MTHVYVGASDDSVHAVHRHVAICHAHLRSGGDSYFPVGPRAVRILHGIGILDRDFTAEAFGWLRS